MFMVHSSVSACCFHNFCTTLAWVDFFLICASKKKGLQLSFAFTILFNFIFYFPVFSGASFSFHVQGPVMFLFRPSVIITQTAGAWQSLKSGHDGRMAL